MSTTAREVAQELRRLADALDKEPDAALPQPLVCFYCSQDKDAFLALARILPRPIFKNFGEKEIELTYGNKYSSKQAENGAIWLYARVDRASMCRIVVPAVPAVFECDPLLSVEEEESLVTL